MFGTGPPVATAGPPPLPPTVENGAGRACKRTHLSPFRRPMCSLLFPTWLHPSRGCNIVREHGRRHNRPPFFRCREAVIHSELAPLPPFSFPLSLFPFFPPPPSPPPPLAPSPSSGALLWPPSPRRHSIDGGERYGVVFTSAGTRGRLEGCDIGGTSTEMAGVVIKKRADPRLINCRCVPPRLLARRPFCLCLCLGEALASSAVFMFVGRCLRLGWEESERAFR